MTRDVADMNDKSEKTRLKTKGVEAVDKALRVLSLFDNREPVLTLGEISERTGLVKSSVLRLLVSLQNAGYLTITQDKRYTVGAEAFRIGRVYQQNFNLETIIRPTLKKLVKTCGESASFFRREGRMRVCLFREDSHQPLREHVAEGDAVAVDKGAAGHVLTDYQEIRGDQPASDELLAALPIVSLRERGPGIAGMSVPIFGVEGNLLGALSLSGPVTRFTPQQIGVMQPWLMNAAAEINRKLRAPFYARLEQSD